MLWNAERENDSVQNACVHARKELIYDYAISGNIKLHGKGGGGTSCIIKGTLDVHIDGHRILGAW